MLAAWVSFRKAVPPQKLPPPSSPQSLFTHVLALLLSQIRFHRICFIQTAAEFQQRGLLSTRKKRNSSVEIDFHSCYLHCDVLSLPKESVLAVCSFCADFLNDCWWLTTAGSARAAADDHPAFLMASTKTHRHHGLSCVWSPYKILKSGCYDEDFPAPLEPALINKHFAHNKSNAIGETRGKEQPRARTGLAIGLLCSDCTSHKSTLQTVGKPLSPTQKLKRD